MEGNFSVGPAEENEEEQRRFFEFLNQGQVKLLSRSAMETLEHRMSQAKQVVQVWTLHQLLGMLVLGVPQSAKRPLFLVER